MLEARIVPYNENRHKEELYRLYLQYGNWSKEAVYSKYGIDYEKVIGGTIEEVGTRVFPVFTSLKPPMGIILILEVDGKAVGMGRLSRLSYEVAEINNMFVSTDFRGHGFGKELLNKLEEKAREFRYSVLRLDTGAHNETAQWVYRKAGFNEINHYDSTEFGRVAKDDTEEGRIYYANKVYMEKKLK